MSNSRKTRITGYHGLHAIILGLTLLALHFPAGAQAPVVPPIAFGQTVQGTLDFNDPTFTNRTRFDAYTFNVAAPGRSYFIIARSPDIPLFSALYRVTPSGLLNSIKARNTVKLDVSSVRGEALSYSGFLQPGRYVIAVANRFLQQPTGPSGLARYTLSLLNAPL
jgi:hypothetical protein